MTAKEIPVGLAKVYSGIPTIHVSVGSHIVTSQVTKVLIWGGQNLQQRCFNFR